MVWSKMVITEAQLRGIITDWSEGLKKLWEVNYLCQGNSSATWSAPVIKGKQTWLSVDAIRITT